MPAMTVSPAADFMRLRNCTPTRRGGRTAGAGEPPNGSDSNARRCKRGPPLGIRGRITASRCVPCLWTALASRKKSKLARVGRGYLKSNKPARSSNGQEETQRTRDCWNHCLRFNTRATAGRPVCGQQALDRLPHSPLSNEIIYDWSVLCLAMLASQIGKTLVERTGHPPRTNCRL